MSPHEALRVAEQAAGGSASGSVAETTDVLTLKQLRIVEDDGTLRMIIGNSTHASATPWRGETVPRPDREPAAGILFMNDDGSECRGLQFAGHRSSEGQPSSGANLTFDCFEQNEGLRVMLVQQGDQSLRLIELLDQPAHALDHREPAWEGVSRLAIARADDGSAMLLLRDGAGRDRIRLVAPLVGCPVVEVLDEKGHAVSLIPPTD